MTVRKGYHTFPQIKCEECADCRRWTDKWTPQQGGDMLKPVGGGENLAISAQPTTRGGGGET